jgi:hypothetical protein
MTQPMNYQALYNQTLASLANGKSADAAATELIGQGIPETNARMMVEDANRMKRAAFRKAGLQLAARGALFVVIGAAVTAVTFAMKLPIFIVAWGPMLFGAINVVKGLYRAAIG